MRIAPNDVNEGGPRCHEMMLAFRDEVAECIEIAGPTSLSTRCDEIDVRFRDVTIEVNDSPVRERASSGWWWLRVPASEDAVLYLRGEY